MKKLVSLLISALLIQLLSSCGSGNTRLSSDDLIGDWYTIKGDVEAYSLMKDNNDYIFVGTLDDRPVVRGTWRIDGPEFILEMDNGTTTSYSIILVNDTLFLNKGEEIYTRNEPLYVSHPETKILDKLRSDLSLDFSEIESAEISWLDGTHKGYSISAETRPGAGDNKKISEYLLSEGYEADSMYVTEVCSGYTKAYGGGIIIVTVCSSYEMDSGSDNASVIVGSALIK